MPGRRSSWARDFFAVDKRNAIDALTNENVESEFDKCIVTCNGKECGATFKRNKRNGTSPLLNHLKKIHGDNLEVNAAIRENCQKVGYKLNI